MKFFKRKQKNPNKMLFRFYEGKLIINVTPKKMWKGTAIFFIALFIFTQIFGLNLNLLHRLNSNLVNNRNSQTNLKKQNTQTFDASKLQSQVLPQEGIVIPIKWGDLGKQLVDTGVIDSKKFESLYTNRGGLEKYEKKILTGDMKNDFLQMNSSNSQFLLNMLWAFGLGNKNTILEEGPMQDERYGGADGFASTGGWSLSKGKAMNHYSAHQFIKLTDKQQELVEKVSKNIYRPCCGNSTYFPDCNHGMAMLGLLELLAANGASEAQMYKTALQVNSYWFPSTYLTIAKLFAEQGISWDKVDPKVALSANYSSSAGYKQVQAQVEPATISGGGGCGV